MDQYFLNYGRLELQRRMVSDGSRTDAYADAIRDVVRPGDVVVDIGTGTGILAMLSARAGARRVYAVEASDMARTAMELVTANGLDDKVQVIYGEAEQLQTEEPVDVIISEWMGCFGLVEGMLDDVLAARDRLLKPEGSMVPVALDVMLAPIDDGVMYGHNGPGFWRRPVHGLDFTSLESKELRQGCALPLTIESASLLAPGNVLVALDDLRINKPEEQWTSGEVAFEIQRDGVLNGFAGWFVARLSPMVVLDTSPYEPDTHWRQTYLPFPTQILTAGSRLEVGYSVRPHPDHHRDIELMLRVGDYEQYFVIE